MLINKGDGTFLAAAFYPAGAGPQSVALGDVNGDGLNDLAVGSGSGCTILLNTSK